MEQQTDSGNFNLNEDANSQPIDHWLNPSADDVGRDAESFLTRLKSPTRLEITGTDPHRRRVLITLLHGNEPSGLKALHRLIREGFKPAVTAYCYLIAVEAARLNPLFTHRQVPGKRDYNRCFRPPFDIDDQGLVCRQLLKDIVDLQPEAVVDMHNTSGKGPDFAVTVTDDDRHRAIATLFSRRLIVTDLRLGAIMESTNARVPVVTIECGGAGDTASDRVAYRGIREYFNTRELVAGEQKDREVFHHPFRVEMLRPGLVTYADAYVPGSDITLDVNVERYNFGKVTIDTPLGWAGPDLMEKLGAFDSHRRNHIRDLYQVRNGRLYPTSDQKLFMVTSDPRIAQSDCLWYAVRNIALKEASPARA
ncbi:MAG: succinylglutamate desuccinylase [Pseudohongiellaceae bacterium]